jgi:hypothetical protein
MLSLANNRFPLFRKKFDCFAKEGLGVVQTLLLSCLHEQGSETTAEVNNERVISFGMRRWMAGKKLKQNRNSAFEVLWIAGTIESAVERTISRVFPYGLIFKALPIQLDGLLQMLFMMQKSVAGTYCSGELNFCWRLRLLQSSRSAFRNRRQRETGKLQC